MSSNLHEFTLQTEALTRSMPAEEMLKLHRALSLFALERVVDRSPVGNPLLWKANTEQGLTKKGDRRKARFVGRDYIGGHFKANWQLELGFFPRGEIEGVDPDGTATKERGRVALADLQPYQLVVIANNLIYGPPLEEGHSSQAPLGIVAVTFQELEQEAQALLAAA